MSAFAEFSERLFASDFLLQGQGYFWQPARMWLHLISDAVITMAYYSIPFILVWAIRRRAPFRWGRLMWMFAGFILACGASHLTSIWNLWHSTYRLEGLIKGVTAALSVATATVAGRFPGKFAPVIFKASSPEAAGARIPTDEASHIMDRPQGQFTRAKAKRGVREAELSSYFEAAAQGIVVASRDGRIVLVNRCTEEWFGYSREELLGSELEMLLPQRHRSAHKDYLAALFADPGAQSPPGSPRWPALELAGLRKDGSEFPIEIGLSVVETEDGILSLGMVNDVTERKRAADQLAETNAELRRSNAELEQFAYIASHDLQEPLRMVTSYLNLLERRYRGRLDDEADEFIRYAVDGATRMKGLIRDVLAVSRIGTQAVKAEAIAAGSVVQDALLNLKAAVEESGALITVDVLPSVFADAGMLTQVFQNLIGNAIKFSGDGASKVHVSAARQGAEWIFSVRDEGIGIDISHAERIFRIFERLNNSEKYSGSGIGPAMSKKIVERHGGRIWVESKPGEGAVFSFSIPWKGAAATIEKALE